MRKLASGPCFSHPTVMMRKTVLGADIKYDDSACAVEDYKLWVDLAKTNVKFANLREPLLVYHRHGGNHSIIHAAKMIEGHKKTQKEYAAYILPARMVQRHRTAFDWLYDSQQRISLKQLSDLYLDLSRNQRKMFAWTFKSGIRDGIDLLHHSLIGGGKVSAKLFAYCLKYKLKSFGRNKIPAARWHGLGRRSR